MFPKNHLMYIHGGNQKNRCICTKACVLAKCNFALPGLRGIYYNITGFTLRFGEIWWSGPHLAMAPNNSQTSSGSDWKYLAFFHFGFTQFPSLSLFLLGRRELFPELGWFIKKHTTRAGFSFLFVSESPKMGVRRWGAVRIRGPFVSVGWVCWWKLRVLQTFPSIVKLLCSAFAVLLSLSLSFFLVLRPSWGSFRVFLISFPVPPPSVRD